MASPPKPWERAGAGATSTTALASSISQPTAATAAAAGIPPAIPARPTALTSAVNQQAQNYSAYGAANRFGSSPYGYGSTMGGVGGYGSSMYGSRYGSSIGGYGSSMYGGGYGSSMYGNSMYGGGGYGMGGMGGMYGSMNGMNGMNGMPMDPNNPSLTQSFGQSTQATFQLIESIVGAFGGFAQMLESTYMATHSSFFAMISVAEQFGTLKQTLGSVLGIFTIMRWLRTLYAKITGRPLPASSKQLTPAKFAEFTGKLPDGTPTPPKPSKKPFIIFMLAIFGLPYLMGKLIKAMAKGQEEQLAKQREQGMLMEAGGAGGMAGQEPIDPAKLEFCRVVFDYTPEANKEIVEGIDLSVKKGDLVAVLSKTDPLGNLSEWWRCRSRDGRMGYLPSPYLEAIQRKPVAAITATSQPVSPVGSRAQTLTASISAPGSRLNSLMKDSGKVPVLAAPKVEGKMGDISAESFQKGGYYQ